MKKSFAVFLCFILILSCGGCKPDNIQYPSDITNPDPAETTVTPDKNNPDESALENTPVALDPAQTPAADAGDTAPQEAKEDEAAFSGGNPLAGATFTPSQRAKASLPVSGIVKSNNAETILKNRTIVLYSAGEEPAFSYQDENGKTVTEWDWMTQIAADNGFIMKYSIKNESISLKSQRVALFAGKKLSLIQMGVSHLAEGLTLCKSSGAFLDLNATTYGISKSVLSQSNHTLFAPVGNINTVWYNAGLMPEGRNPATLFQNNQWTIAAFQELSTQAAEKRIIPFLMQESLAWATLSGKSPLTLLDGKLDSNINARATRSVWAALRELNASVPSFIQDEDVRYSLKDGTVAMEYTLLPEKGEGMTLEYVPLPALEEGAGTAVTYGGVFLGLPKYEENESTALAALSFAELWCNRYAEARAGQLLALGISGHAYQTYADLAENGGYLILHSAIIEEKLRDYLAGLSDPSIDMDAAYDQISASLTAYIATQNLYY